MVNGIDGIEPVFNTIEDVCLKKKVKQISDPLSRQSKYDVIIGAVAHDEFKKYSDGNVSSISKQNVVLINVKNIFSNPTWSL